VIAAGSTGSMPATAKFLHAVAALPQGAVVLPGLDIALDDEAWQLIGGVRDAQGKFIQPPASNHPQFAMQALLHRLGIRRGDVERLSEPAAHGRDVLYPRRCGLQTRRQSGTGGWPSPTSPTRFRAA